MRTKTHLFIAPRTLLRLMLFVVIVMTGFQAHAAKEIFNTRQAGSGIRNGLVLYVADDKFDYMRTHADWASAFGNRKVTNKVILGIDPYGRTFMNAPFTAHVQVEILYDRWDEVSGAFVQETEIRDLEVQYTTSGTYKDKNILLLDNGGHRMQVTVISYTLPSGLAFVPNISLEAEIEVERFYAFDPHYTIPPASLRHDGNVTYVNGRNELLITWDPVAGAEEYDLEWAYINNFDEDGLERTAQGTKMDHTIFRLNSTRITTSGNYYFLPLTFEPGFIVYRLRPVGRDPESGYEQILPGSWSKDPEKCSASASVGSCMFPHVYNFKGLSTGMNWQSSVDYIEGGKNKVAITYFDASLRNRQQQARLNEEDKVLIGETIYDKDGRAAIQVLPVPENKQNVTYSENFNRNMSGQPYSKEDFETNGAECATSAPMESMERNEKKGAANYYSPQNEEQDDQQAYLPDAQGYPFVQTVFTKDNTGRVQAKSGAGKDHRIGSGHETKFYYGQPFQEELDRLFGLDVGVDKNYKKNVTVDPNGQVMVNYVDAQGKVIATALAGETPASLEALPGSPDRTVTIDLMSKADPSDPAGTLDMLSPDGKTRVLNRNYISTSNGPRDFEYDITPGTFETKCDIPNTAPKCYNCVVHVTLSVKDECGNEIFPAMDNATHTQTIGTGSVGCSTSQETFSKDAPDVSMNVGSYQISKIITIDEKALDAYTADFLDPDLNPCILDFENFLDEELTGLDTSGCGMDCDQCREKIGVYDSWNQNPYNKSFNPACDPCLSTEEEYKKLIGSCDRLCKNETVTCETAFDGMLMDVSPYGQYGGVVANTNPVISKDGKLDEGTLSSGSTSRIDPSVHELSVFNEGNKLPVHRTLAPDWKHPQHYSNADPYHYFDKNGAIAKVSVLVLRGASAGEVRYLPELDEAAEPVTPPAPGTSILVEPQSLKHIEDFLAFWKPEWATSLVIYHPEFCYYELCVQTQASHEFDTEWLAVDKVSDAQAAFGFGSGLSSLPQPLADAPLNALDPYFRSDPAVNPRFQLWEYKLMKRRMEFYMRNPSTGNYISIWEAAHVTANCPNYMHSSTSCPDCLSAFDGINTDDEWVQFRSMYLSLKQSFQDYKTRLQTIKQHCYNGCIGEENFDPSAFRIYDPDLNDFNFFAFSLSPFFDFGSSSQTCNAERSALFKNKTKRFPTASDMLDLKNEDKKCYEEIQIPVNDGTYTTLDFPNVDELTECPEENEDKIRQLQERADRIFFETCGQCPLARDMQFLLDAIAREDRDGAGNVIKASQLTEPSPFNLSCYPMQSVYKEFTSGLESALGLPGTGIILWDQANMTNKRLDAVIRRQNGTEQCSISLAIPDTIAYTFSDIRGMCCVLYTSAPTLLPLQLGHNFTLEGLIPVTSPDGKTTVVKIPMEGVSCVDISTCPMLPVCEVTAQGEALESLFDALISESTVSSHKFVTGPSAEVDIFSSTPGEFAPYSYIIRNVLDDPATGALTASNWVWTSTETGNQLRGYIKDKSSADAIVFDFFLPDGADFGFKDIVEISRIRADRVNDNSGFGFILSALVQRPDGSRESFDIKGFSFVYRISDCHPVTVISH